MGGRAVKRFGLMVVAAMLGAAVIVGGLTMVDNPRNVWALGAGATLELQVTGVAGVPLDAAAVVLNMTAVNAQAAGFATVYPCGQSRPEASNLNYAAGQTIPNVVIAKPGVGGKVCIYSYATIDVLADVSGFFPAGSAFTPISNPTRVLDTRTPAPTAAPTPTPTPTPTPPSSFTYSGQGDAVIEIAKPNTGPVLVELDIQSNSNAIVWALDANLDNNDLLVNEIGDYQGVRLMDLAFFAPQTSRYLDVTATGPWTISVRSVTTVPSFDSNTAGRGDRVLLYTGPARVMRLIHDGPSNFIVWHHRDYLSASTDSDLVVNVIGPYNATRPFAAGPALIEIMADGNWSIGP